MRSARHDGGVVDAAREPTTEERIGWYSEGLGLEAAGVHVNRGFVQVNEKMQALDEAGSPIDGLWCIGDLNGKMMLAHAASGLRATHNRRSPP